MINSDARLKLAVQTMLIAIDMIPRVDDLIKFVGKIIGNRKIPKTVTDMKSRYEMFLKLTPFIDPERILPAYQVYAVLLSIPQVKCLFDTDKKRMFLMHLTVIPQNSFEYPRLELGWIKTNYIYDVLSLINHSCAPNIFFYQNPSEISHCVVVRPISRGQQLFINYLGNDVKKTDAERRERLKFWSFSCKCERCQPRNGFNSNTIKAILQSDLLFQFIERTCLGRKCKKINQENGKRSMLKIKCSQFLQKFGHLNWTKEIEFAIHCYIFH